MKKNSTILLTALFSVLAFSGCENLLGSQSSSSDCNSQQAVEQHYPKRFMYVSTEVLVAENVTLTDLETYIPFQYKNTIKSIDDLKNVIKENVRSYSVVKQTENGTVKLFADPTIKIIWIESADACKIRIGDEDTTCSYSFADNGYTINVEGENLLFEQEEFSLSYTVMFDEGYGFGVKHCYEPTF